MNTDQSSRIKSWNGKDYKDGSWVQFEMGLKFLELLDLTNKTVIDAGCGTGKITYEIAKRYPKTVLGFDLSENMIQTAKESYSSYIEHASDEKTSCINFVVGSIESIALDKSDVIVSFFVLHWVGKGNDEKEIAIKNMYEHLNDNGEFLFTVLTEENRIVEFKTINQLCTRLIHSYPTLEMIDKIKSELETYQNLTYDSTKLKNLLHGLKCKILKYEVVNFKPTFENREHLEKSIRPLIFGQPFIKYFPDEKHEDVFNMYVDCLIDNLEANPDGSFSYPMTTTLVHLKK